ncbi:hypothetical protein GW17_00021039, partial [Ensete ventricosum]
MDGSLVPRHGGWLLEWRSSGQEEAPQVGSGAAPAKRSGRVRAYIVGAVGHPYLATLLPLWLTMPSYPSTTPVVLARPHTCIRLASRVGSATSAGQLSEGARTWRLGHYLPCHSPPWEDLLEVPDEGAEDEVLCLAAGPWWLWTSPEWELWNLNGAGADPIEQELGSLND